MPSNNSPKIKVEGTPDSGQASSRTVYLAFSSAVEEVFEGRGSSPNAETKAIEDFIGLDMPEGTRVISPSIRDYIRLYRITAGKLLPTPRNRFHAVIRNASVGVVSALVAKLQDLYAGGMTISGLKYIFGSFEETYNCLGVEELSWVNELSPQAVHELMHLYYDHKSGRHPYQADEMICTADDFRLMECSGALEYGDIPRIVEEGTVRTIFKEGLADWVMRIVHISIKGKLQSALGDRKIDPEEAHRQVEKMASGKLFEIDISDRAVDRYARIVRDFISGHSKRVGEEIRGKPLPLSFLRLPVGRYRIQEISYAFGTHFVSGAVKLLCSQDLSLPRAIDMLILSPPLTVAELKEPGSYVDRLKTSGVLRKEGADCLYYA